MSPPRWPLSRRARDRLGGGSVSVVTGGAGGLGLAFCELLVAAGGKVALVDVNADALASAKARLEGLYPDAEVIAERVDIADHAQVKAFRDLVLQRWGKVQHVVNNAGVTDKHDAWDFEGPGMDEFKKVVDVNLWGTVYMTNAFIKDMCNDTRPCHLINISSVGGLRACDPPLAYSVSKYAVRGLTEWFAIRLPPTGPLQCTVAFPGSIATVMNKGVGHAPERVAADILNAAAAGRSACYPGDGALSYAWCVWLTSLDWSAFLYNFLVIVEHKYRQPLIQWCKRTFGGGVHQKKES